MLRYNSVCFFPGQCATYDFSPCKKEYGPSIVDKSHFVPISEQVKALAFSGSTGGQGCYDFADGRDNGMVLPVHRRKNVDLAELSQEVRRNQDIVQSNLKAAVDYDKAFASVSDSVVDSKGVK